MPINSSVRIFYSSLPRKIALITFMVLAIAAMDYLAQASAQEASPPFHTSLEVPPGLIGDEWTGGPRECDLFNGISTACVFMD